MVGVSDAQSCVSWLSHINTNTIFFLKSQTTFLTCVSRGKRGKICRKESVPQPCLELITIRSWVRQAHLWATWMEHNPENDAFWKHHGKRRKCWLPAFSVFRTMFSTPRRKKYHFSNIQFVILQMFSIWSSWNVVPQAGSTKKDGYHHSHHVLFPQ